MIKMGLKLYSALYIKALLWIKINHLNDGYSKRSFTYVLHTVYSVLLEKAVICGL